MVKIWGSSKNDQNRIAGKLLKLEKFIFTILHFVVVVVVVVTFQIFNSRISKTGLNGGTKLCELIEIHEHYNINTPKF